MCGIYGELRLGRDAIYLERQLSMLGHRGPDDFGQKSWSGPDSRAAGAANNAPPYVVGFGQRRLSIIDLSPLGHQPMVSCDGRYVIIYNGEIYNYLELKQELERNGQVFRSNCDTEVLLEGLATWGVRETMKKCVGMFAFALFDRGQNELHLCRDVFGIKPLFYYNRRGRLVFASELEPIVTDNDVPLDLHRGNTWKYLRYGATDHGSDTLITGVKHVPPGACVTFKPAAGLIAEASNQCVDLCGEGLSRSDISYGEAVHAVRSRVLETVALHMRSDVPVSIALSGGLDSSAILGCAKSLYPKAEIHTFSYLASDPRINESRWIDLVAQQVGSVQHAVRVAPEELVASIDTLIRRQGEPFQSTSIFAQFFLFREVARHGIKVILDGQGADEIFGGYSYYQGARIASLVRCGAISRAVRLLRAQSQYGDRQSGEAVAHTLNHLLPPQFRHLARAVYGKSEFPGWLDRAWFAGKAEQVFRYEMDLGSKEYLRARLKHDITNTGLRQLLRYEDRNSMAFSVESRVPFLTPYIARFVLSLPEEYLIDDAGRSKAVLRDAMQGIVPDPILTRKDKIGFSTPEDKWLLRNERIVGILSTAFEDVPCFKSDAVRQYIGSILSGRAPYTRQAWRILCFSLWYKSLSAKSVGARWSMSSQ